MAEKSGNADLEWLEKELGRVRKAGAVVYDKKTGETVGILTHNAEQVLNKPVAADPKEKQLAYVNEWVDRLRSIPPMSLDGIHQHLVNNGADPDYVPGIIKRAVGLTKGSSVTLIEDGDYYCGVDYKPKLAEPQEQSEQTAKEEAEQESRASTTKRLRTMPEQPGMAEAVEWIMKQFRFSREEAEREYCTARDYNDILFGDNGPYGADLEQENAA